MAQHAEAVGFDSLWLADHLIFNLGENLGEALGVPGIPRTGIWECWSVLASLAAVTTRVELGTIVACTSFRNPALLAQMADTVDEICNGRLILGLGPGAAWSGEEYRAFGYPFDQLVGRFEEAFQIIHPPLRTGAVDFRGKYYSAIECELLPRGPRSEGPPILIGASQRRMLRLTAQYADYWNGYSINQVESLAPRREAVDEACAKVGRDAATLKRTIMLLVDLPGSEKAAGSVHKLRAFRPPASGTPEQLAELLWMFARNGIDHVQLWLEPRTRWPGSTPSRPCWNYSTANGVVRTVRANDQWKHVGVVQSSPHYRAIEPETRVQPGISPDRVRTAAQGGIPTTFLT